VGKKRRKKTKQEKKTSRNRLAKGTNSSRSKLPNLSGKGACQITDQNRELGGNRLGKPHKNFHEKMRRATKPEEKKEIVRKKKKGYGVWRAGREKSSVNSTQRAGRLLHEQGECYKTKHREKRIIRGGEKEPV